MRIKTRTSPLSDARLYVFDAEPKRLQREADLFTFKLEHERKRKVSLSQQVRQLSVDLIARSRETKAKTPTSSAKTGLTNKIQQLEHKLELALKKTSRIQAENAELRRQIDRHRQDNYLRKGQLASLKREIYEDSSQAEQHNSTYLDVKSTVDSKKHQIFQLRSKSYSDNLQKKGKIEELTVRPS
jgi:chromosome segregation ATPase